MCGTNIFYVWLFDSRIALLILLDCVSLFVKQSIHCLCLRFAYQRIALLFIVTVDSLLDNKTYVNYLVFLYLYMLISMHGTVVWKEHLLELKIYKYTVV